MATITVTKEIALERIQEIISDARKLIEECKPTITQNDYRTLLNRYETWMNSTIIVLAEIFTEKKISETFFSAEDISLSEETHSEKILSLTSEISNEITKLEGLIKSLQMGIYSQEENPTIVVAKIARRQAITISIITAIAGIITGIIAGYLGIPHKIDPVKQQGFKNISLNGKYKYLCTSFDGTYQHGGRIIVQKGADGSLVLHGERMWKDIKDTITNKWHDSNFAEGNYLQWSSDWIYVINDSKINFEYEISSQNNLIKGYCTGDILTDEKGKVQSLTGNFYVLNSKPILNGSMLFQAVNDSIYNTKSTLKKNHS